MGCHCNFARIDRSKRNKPGGFTKRARKIGGICRQDYYGTGKWGVFEGLCPFMSDGVQDASDQKVASLLEQLHPAEPEPDMPAWDQEVLEFPSDEEARRERLV